MLGFAAVEEAASRLAAISLSQVLTADCLDRIDTKFLMPIGLVPDLLQRCAPEYQVLEVNQKRLCRYRTQYFDTAELLLYHSHHAGRTPRHKVRVRTYLETNQEYLEVKLKTNKGRTRKSRVRLRNAAAIPFERLHGQDFFGVAAVVSPVQLRQVVTVTYTRITLVSATALERVTLDLGLEFSSEAGSQSYPGLVIAELKQARNGRSCFQGTMKAMGVRNTTVSKYCLGVISLYEQVKKNRYKRILYRIQRMGEHHVAPASGQ